MPNQSVPTIFFTLFLLLTGTVTNCLFAQNPVNILEADSIVGGMVKGERVQKILGNVHVQTQNFELFSDSAYQFVDKSEIKAFGNIQINTPEEHIWADSLTYFTDVDFSRLRGRVIIETDSTTLFGKSVDYRFTTKVAHFIDQIRLEDQRGILKADSGFYFREADSAEFRGHVQLADSTQYIEGDSLFSNRSSDYYELYGDIFANDKENNTLLKGDYLEADSTGRRILEGNAWLRNVNTDTVQTAETDADSAVVLSDTTTVTPDSLVTAADAVDSEGNPDEEGNATSIPDEQSHVKSDTTHIRAKKIHLMRQETPADTSSIIDAYHNVRIWSNKFAAISDTAKYNDRTQTFELWSNSIAWHKQIQLTGPYIKVILINGDIDRLISHTDVFITQEDTTIDRLNQLKGDSLITYFEEGEISEMHLNGNTRLLRYTKNELQQPDGGLISTAPKSIFYFENGELYEFKHSGALQGDYLPESKSLADRRLEGFSWNPEIRPLRPKEKMKPRFPPISEEPLFELPRRYLEHLKKKEESDSLP